MNWRGEHNAEFNIWIVNHISFLIRTAQSVHLEGIFEISLFKTKSKQIELFST
jgi:hypothetical protein